MGASTPGRSLKGIAATAFYDQVEAFFTRCAKELLGDGDRRAHRDWQMPAPTG